MSYQEEGAMDLEQNRDEGKEEQDTLANRELRKGGASGQVTSGGEVTGGAGDGSPVVGSDGTCKEGTARDTTNSTNTLEEQAPRRDLPQAYEVSEPGAIVADEIDIERQRRQRIALLLLALAVVAAIVAGITVPVVNNRRGDAQSQREEEILEAEVYSMDVSLDSFFEARRVRLPNGETKTTGFFTTFFCDTRPCLENPDVCVTKKRYEPGCCMNTTASCPEEERCGEHCSEDSCLPSSDKCTSLACFECKKGPLGEELYFMYSFVVDINCLDTGKKVDPQTGEEHKWAVACGPQIYGDRKDQNLAIGEYACFPWREQSGMVKTRGVGVPCQWVQLNECGCGPPDMHTFGLDMPTKPCRTKEDCRFLCYDAGEEHAQNLCYEFGID